MVKDSVNGYGLHIEVTNAGRHGSIIKVPVRGDQGGGAGAICPNQTNNLTN